jgi:DNA-binding CsgD family transcriptional regulator/tetratricopeptide (TPR) repeat protein
MTHDGPQLPEFPMVGRGEVWERLVGALSDAAQGRGSALLLHGERGIGKSSLCDLLAEEAERRGFLRAEGRAYRAESGVPYALAVDAFLPLLKSQSREVLTVLTRGGAGDLAYLFPGLDTDGGHRPPALSEAAGELRTRVLWTFTEFLRELAKRQPLLVVLEDLQWADPSSLEMAHLVSRRLRGGSALVLLTSEGTSEGREQALQNMERSLREQGVASEIRLHPFSPEETGKLLESGFGVEAEALREFTRVLHDRTQGNPFIILETLQALVQEGRLYRKGGVWLGWETRGMELPTNVWEAVLPRVESLPREARELAEIAAILGGPFPLAHLRATSPMAPSALLEALDLLLAREILSERCDAGGRVVFEHRHPLVREVLIRAMGLTRMRLLHARVAAGLEVYFGDHAEAHAGTLAYHLLEAGDEGLGAKGAHYLLRAGQMALERGGNAEAARYLRKAEELLPLYGRREPSLPGIDELAVLHDLARALTRLGEAREALRYWQKVRLLAEERGDVETSGECRRRTGIIRGSMGDPAGALAEFDAVLSAPGLRYSPTLLNRARLGRGMALEELGRQEEAREELEAALSAARELSDPVTLAKAHRALVFLHTWTGNVDRVREHAGRAMELARTCGDRSVEFWTLWGLAVLDGLLGHTGPMAERVAEARRVAEEMRSPVLALYGTELEIEHAAATGRWDTGIAVGEQAISLARSLSLNDLLPRLLVWTSLIYLGRGETELARPLVEEAWDLGGAGGEDPLNVHTAIPACIGMGFLALTEGEYRKAARYGQRGLDLADSLGYVLWAIHRLLPLLGETYLLQKDLVGARRLGKRLMQQSQAIGHKLGLAWARSCEALVIGLEGDPRRGAEEMEAAARALEEIPMIPDATRLRRQLAGRLAEIGDREGALGELARVHEIFLRLGAERELEKTREMFRELEARPPRKIAPGVGAMSAREAEIAGMVEQRMSNKAIGRQLGISVRTVSTHLSNIYQKLGIGSRAELTDLLRSQAGPRA